jgi:hypothetical protein
MNARRPETAQRDPLGNPGKTYGRGADRAQREPGGNPGKTYRRGADRAQRDPGGKWVGRLAPPIHE